MPTFEPTGGAHNQQVEPSDLIVAGYVLAVPTDAPLGDEALPAKILTISHCIMEDLPRPEYWDWFLDLDQAKKQRAVSAVSCEILKVAIRRSDVLAFVEANGGTDQPYFSLLNRDQVLDGEILGYEIVGADWTLDFHSWHCHAYAGEARASLGVRVNELGLLSSYSDAIKVLGWMLDLPASEAPAPVHWSVVALARA